MGNKYSKIPISKFISDKKLDTISSIIEKNPDDVETNYDRIELILDDDFEPKDLGTNRLILIHKKKKYKHLVFKVAGDNHGIEANYREFYNGDLDKRLTYSYAISKNGIFLVQERVTGMTKDLMKKHKKDIKDMLDHLSKKLLLVDCKLTNFKNFGIRKNGEVCLLDHGDTVPLPKYQGDNIINANEEANVSLRCKRVTEHCENIKKIRPCGGKLKYSKDYSYLICEKCGGTSTVNEAYREFYGDERISTNDKRNLQLVDGFDLKKWKEEVKEYCINTMENVNNNKKGKNEMKTKIINGKNCVQIKGFWLPEPTEIAMIQLYNSVRMGTVKPHKYLEACNLNIDDYKVYPDEHTPSDKNNSKFDAELKYEADRIVEKAIDICNTNPDLCEYIRENDVWQVIIKFNNIKDIIGTNNPRIISFIRKKISENEAVRGCKYTETEYSIWIKSDYIHSIEQNNDANNKQNSFDPNIYMHPTESSNNTTPEKSNKYLYNYMKNNPNAKIVNDLDDDNADKNYYQLSQKDIDGSTIEYNGEKCVVIGKYAIPAYVVDALYDDELGAYVLKSKPKAILKSANLVPKKYKLVDAFANGESDAMASEAQASNIRSLANISTKDNMDSVYASNDQYEQENISEKKDVENLESETMDKDPKMDEDPKLNILSDRKKCNEFLSTLINYAIDMVKNGYYHTNDRGSIKLPLIDTLKEIMSVNDYDSYIQYLISTENLEINEDGEFTDSAIYDICDNIITNISKYGKKEYVNRITMIYSGFFEIDIPEEHNEVSNDENSETDSDLHKSDDNEIDSDLIEPDLYEGDDDEIDSDLYEGDDDNSDSYESDDDDFYENDDDSDFYEHVNRHQNHIEIYNNDNIINNEDNTFESEEESEMTEELISNMKKLTEILVENNNMLKENNDILKKSLGDSNDVLKYKIRKLDSETIVMFDIKDLENLIMAVKIDEQTVTLNLHDLIVSGLNNKSETGYMTIKDVNITEL